VDSSVKLGWNIADYFFFNVGCYVTEHPPNCGADEHCSDEHGWGKTIIRCNPKSSPGVGCAERLISGNAGVIASLYGFRKTLSYLHRHGVDEAMEDPAEVSGCPIVHMSTRIARHRILIDGVMMTYTNFAEDCLGLFGTK
jgi:hypothetical protein